MAKLLKCPYYVSMTDKFLSGWGMADGRRARYIACAKSYEEAQIVADNARRRKDQKNITIASTPPRMNNHDLYRFMTKLNSPKWYKEGAWSQEKPGGR